MLEIIEGILLWTFLSYWVHRAAHYPSVRNPLLYIHNFHHRIDYSNPSPRWPRFGEYFFWFGKWQRSVDVILSLSIPCLVSAWIIGGMAWWLLPTHYIYEVFFGDTVLDHNPVINGLVTHLFSWGQFHLEHHRRQQRNFALSISFWDRLFGTYDSHYLKRI